MGDFLNLALVRFWLLSLVIFGQDRYSVVRSGWMPLWLIELPLQGEAPDKFLSVMNRRT